MSQGKTDLSNFGIISFCKDTKDDSVAQSPIFNETVKDITYGNRISISHK